MQQSTKRQSKRMQYFSTLAGPLRNPPTRRRYAVSFSDLISHDQLVYRYWTRIVAYGALLATLVLAFVLFQPTHWIAVLHPDSTTHTLNIIMLACLMILQLFLILGTYSATRSTINAKDPIPIKSPKGLRIAFVTTRAPNEPVQLVRTTLEAMKRVYPVRNKVDVWLLDETADSELQSMCKELGVRYFSRAGISEWNTPKPQRTFLRNVNKPNLFMAARSKHGNFNAWRAHLKKQKITYDLLAGVDTDQVPEPNFLKRLLGYFRDANVAYVVGPQVYGNYQPGLRNLVVRWAESQASFFQSTVQRAGNASASPMFVGTNYVVRMSVLNQIGGFQPCITEDMATGLAIHTKRNPATGRHWKSIYTPDVLAVGEGPNMWGPYFTQQWRWAAGTFDTWRRVVWRVFFKLSPKAMLHYLLMLTFYPITALTWLLGIASTMIYLTTGATAILAPWAEFMSLYMMSLIMQLSLYFWNRRFNVSPHEPQGSYGVSGMVLTSLTAPIYLSALVGVVLGKKVSFVVTSKGGGHSYDGLKTFTVHLSWAFVLACGLAYGYSHEHDHPAMLVWAALQLAVCLTPVILGWVVWTPERLRKKLKAHRRFTPVQDASHV